MKFLFIVGVFCIAHVYSEETRLDDLPPQEAQQLLDKQDLSLSYAPKIESNVPALRFLGKEQHEVLEDIYLARQFHGQDGLGGYVYGYAVPDIAKSEKKEPNGNLKGSYSYINGDGQEIKVEYYDDGNGFHHTDNLPTVELVQIEDTPEVKAARDEHFRIWNEIAEKHRSLNPNAVQEEESKYNEEEEKYDGRYDGPEPKAYVPRPEETEEVKDPRGFFYSFDYPAGIIVDKGRAVGGASQHNKRETFTKEQKDVFDNTRSLLNSQAQK